MKKEVNKKVKKYSGKRFIYGGYICLSIDGKVVKEHRLIMEKYLGRKLRSDEVVHHKDLDKLNNSLKNLVVMNVNEHTKLHGDLRRQPKYKKIYIRSKQKNKMREKTKKIYLSIWNYIKEYNRLPNKDILDMSRQTRQRYINILQIEGKIQKIGYGTWRVISNNPLNFGEGYKEKDIVFQRGVGNERSKLFKYPLGCDKLGGEIRDEIKKKEIRAHGYKFSLKLPYIKNWENRVEYLNKKNINFRQLQMGQQIKYRSSKVWLCKRAIVVFFQEGKSFCGITANEAFKMAMADIKSFIRGLENLLNVNLHINKEYQIKIFSQHYADMFNDIARERERKGKKDIKLIYYQGEPWLCFDFSNNIPELETIHKKTAVNDMDNIITPFMNDLKEYNDVTGDFISPLEHQRNINLLVKGISEFSQNQNILMKDLQAVVGIIKDNSQNITNLSKTMETTTNILNNILQSQKNNLNKEIQENEEPVEKSSYIG